ncbi:MAG: ribosome maturation factor RimM [Bacteroidaceae bacterium]|nr:ribosome maturation factor RimM [Bacteroidaceae bacterium]
MIKESEVYPIGILNKPHGVKGEITFTFTSDVWDRVEADYLICEVDGILVPFFLEEYRFRTDHSAILKFQGMDTVEAVQEMTGLKVYFPHSLTPQDEEEEGYTWQYFQGFHIEDAQGNGLGVIDSVDDATENVLFEVGDLLIPAAEELIVNIDHEKKIIQMQLPEGLTEL